MRRPRTTAGSTTAITALAVVEATIGLHRERWLAMAPQLELAAIVALRTVLERVMA